MILTITYLIVAILQPANLTIVTTFKQPDLSSQSIPLVQPDIQGVPIGPEHLTIVKTWKLN